MASLRLAETYWQRCATESRISTEFRALCATCGETLAALPRTGGFDDKASKPARSKLHQIL
jgi:hypothetical protein